MRPVGWFCVPVVVVIASMAQADPDEVELQAQVGISSAYETDGELQKSELTLEPRMDVQFSGDTGLTVIGLVRADFADELEPGRPSNASRSTVTSRIRAGDYIDVELRELFVDFELGDAQLRAGKQQVVWGQADGLRILDVINPLSYREFILPDFEDRRIPLWMVNVEVPVGDANLQLLWIPDQSYDEFPDVSAAYAFSSSRFRPALEPGENIRIKALSKPNRFLADSDFGVRLGAFVGGWDLTANYLYHFRDQPIPVLNRSSVVTELAPSYKRTHLMGGSASKPVGDFVLRGEIGYSTDRYFVSALDASGVKRTHETSGVVGLDYTGISDMLISGQFFQGSINSSHGILKEKHERSWSLLVRRTFLNDTVTLEMLAIHNSNDADGLVQLEIVYQISSNVTLSVGSDVFYGPDEGLFGQFSGRDRMTLSLGIGI